jgi:hypothetical protein
MLYYRNRAKFADSFRLTAAWSMGVMLTFNIFFTYILPLALASKHQARTAAEEIDSFCGSPEILLCGTGFVGEEPFTAHLKTKWRMVHTLDEMTTLAGCVITAPETQHSLEGYKRKYVLQETVRKRLNYKSHKYILVKLERNDEKR